MAIVRVIVPEIVPTSDQNRLRNAAKVPCRAPRKRQRLFSEPGMRQTAALQGFARLSSRADPPAIAISATSKAAPTQSGAAAAYSGLLNRCLSAASCENRFSANARWFESLTPGGLQRKTIPRQRAGDNPSVAPKAPTTSTLGVFLMDTSRFQSV